MYKRQVLADELRRTGAVLLEDPDDPLRHGLPEARRRLGAVSYTHLRAHETVLDLVCRLLLEKKKYKLSNLPSLLTLLILNSYTSLPYRM